MRKREKTPLIVAPSGRHLPLRNERAWLFGRAGICCHERQAGICLIFHKRADFWPTTPGARNDNSCLFFAYDRRGLNMSKSRRDFLTLTSLGMLSTAALARLYAQNPSDLPPGAPPAFGSGPDFGPAVTVNTFAEGEKLVQFPMTDSEREMAAASWRKTLASVYERRTGPRKLALEPTLAPAAQWNPLLPGIKPPELRDRFIRSKTETRPVPANDADIAFAPVTHLSHWVEGRQLSSERLTKIYLD